MLRADIESEPSETIVLPLLSRQNGAFSIGRARAGTLPRCEEKNLGTLDSVTTPSFVGLSGETLITHTGSALVGYELAGEPFDATPTFHAEAMHLRSAALSKSYLIGIFNSSAQNESEALQRVRWLGLSSGATTYVPNVPPPSAAILLDESRALLSYAVDGGSSLQVHTLDGPSGAVASFAGLNLALALGSDGTIYGVGGRELSVLGPDLKSEWGVEFDTIGSSVTLDCARNEQGAAIAGRPGTLYTTVEAGQVLSVVTDSRGLSSTAPWPVARGDGRGTKRASALGRPACP